PWQLRLRERCNDLGPALRRPRLSQFALPGQPTRVLRARARLRLAVGRAERVTAREHTAGTSPLRCRHALRPAMNDAAAEPSKVRFSGHMPGLDGVRGAAILMVMLNHFVGDAAARTTVQRLLTKAAGYGVFGVDLFFVLSGFLITGILLDAKERPSY